MYNYNKKLIFNQKNKILDVLKENNYIIFENLRKELWPIYEKEFMKCNTLDDVLKVQLSWFDNKNYTIWKEIKNGNSIN